MFGLATKKDVEELMQRVNSLSVEVTSLRKDNDFLMKMHVMKEKKEKKNGRKN